MNPAFLNNNPARVKQKTTRGKEINHLLFTEKRNLRFEFDNFKNIKVSLAAYLSLMEF
jgi:hypothetical protein